MPTGRCVEGNDGRQVRRCEGHPATGPPATPAAPCLPGTARPSPISITSSTAMPKTLPLFLHAHLSTLLAHGRGADYRAAQDDGGAPCLLRSRPPSPRPAPRLLTAPREPACSNPWPLCLYSTKGAVPGRARCMQATGRPEEGSSASCQPAARPGSQRAPRCDSATSMPVRARPFRAHDEADARAQRVPAGGRAGLDPRGAHPLPQQQHRRPDPCPRGAPPSKQHHCGHAHHESRGRQGPKDAAISAWPPVSTSPISTTVSHLKREGGRKPTTGGVLSDRHARTSGPLSPFSWAARLHGGRIFWSRGLLVTAPAGWRHRGRVRPAPCTLSCSRCGPVNQWGAATIQPARAAPPSSSAAGRPTLRTERRKQGSLGLSWAPRPSYSLSTGAPMHRRQMTGATLTARPGT